MKKIARFWWIPVIVIVLALAGFTAWAYTPPAPMPEALAALQSDAEVQVQSSPWLVFRPAHGEPTAGLIFYPGGRVNYRSYAPTLRAIAAGGYLVVCVPMPFNLAIFGAERATPAMAAYASIKSWAIGGHSLGGAMAARYAYNHPGAVAGLVLWAAYPASTDNLSARDLRVVSIYGTRDGLATAGKIDASRPLLPANTRWVAIEGGNHAQFGWYGAQPGDNPAIISRPAQTEQIVKATLELLQQLGPPAQ